MKFLAARPPVPPYLHLGSVRLEMPARTIRDGRNTREIDNEWRKLFAHFFDNPRKLHAILKRTDERPADLSCADCPYEVFYTITDDGQDQVIIDYYF